MFSSSFFDAELVGGTYDRVYAASNFAEYFASFIANGVFPDPATNLQVVANTTPNMTVLVSAGMGWINGYYCKNSNPYPIAIAAASGSQARIDSIMLRWDKAARNITAYVKMGTPSSNPQAPSVERTPDVFELMLATVLVGAGVTKINQANITDKRTDSSVCGIVKGVVDQINTSDLFAQYDDEFQTWFADLQAQLSGDVATKLQNQINELKTGKLNVDSKASSSEAQLGTEDTKYMTALKSKQAVDYRIPTQAVAEAGTDNVKLMTPLRTKQAIDKNGMKVTNQWGGIGVLEVDGPEGQLPNPSDMLMYGLAGSLYSPGSVAETTDLFAYVYRTGSSYEYYSWVATISKKTGKVLTSFTIDPSNGVHSNSYYPHIGLLPNGNIFAFGPKGHRVLDKTTGEVVYSKAYTVDAPYQLLYNDSKMFPIDNTTCIIMCYDYSGSTSYSYIGLLVDGVSQGTNLLLGNHQGGLPRGTNCYKLDTSNRFLYTPYRDSNGYYCYGKFYYGPPGSGQGVSLASTVNLSGANAHSDGWVYSYIDGSYIYAAWCQYYFPIEFCKISLSSFLKSTTITDGRYGYGAEGYLGYDDSSYLYVGTYPTRSSNRQPPMNILKISKSNLAVVETISSICGLSISAIKQNSWGNFTDVLVQLSNGITQIRGVPYYDGSLMVLGSYILNISKSSKYSSPVSSIMYSEPFILSSTQIYDLTLRVVKKQKIEDQYLPWRL